MAIHTFHCIDAHTCGNPVRVIREGGPILHGSTMSQKRQHFIREFDWIRRGLMFEPRGHDMMSGGIFYPPTNPENDIAFLFMETSGCLPMCGHGTIGAITIGIQERLIEPKTSGRVRLETPGGLVLVEYGETDGKVEWVGFRNVKSYLAAEGLTVTCPDLGELKFDVAYGGNYYAIIDEQRNFSGIQHFSADRLVAYGREIRRQINSRYPDRFVHPEDTTIRDVSHVLWAGEPLSETASARNAVFYGDKAIDRSPCGTGTSARMAQWHAKGKLTPGEAFVHESYIGSQFVGIIEEETTLAGLPAIVPNIKGWARVYGYNQISIDEDDPYAFGFQVI